MILRSLVEVAFLTLIVVTLHGLVARVATAWAAASAAEAPPFRRPPAVPAADFARRGWDADVEAHPPKDQFVRFFRMRATAYTPIATRMEGGRYTRTLRDGRSAHGIAVDPDLIPLGSRLWIPGYGHAIADDIGGRIRGHRVDVRVQDAENMRDWGNRHVRVYVLEEPAPQDP